MQFGQTGAGIQGQLGTLPSYPYGPQVGHLKLTAQLHSLNYPPLVTILIILPNYLEVFITY